ncbi:MAG: alpha/beta fold hydrolase, partial [Chloroflexi bacterium]|nr:alpha/beta fold hydrolase [Chloroflexota bacterium]
MVFVHGMTRRWQTWLPAMLAFACDHPVYALDLRGHGRSDRAADFRAIDYARESPHFSARRSDARRSWSVTPSAPSWP